jgi:hypothetical protein
VDQVIEHLLSETKSGRITVQAEGRPVTDDQQVRTILTGQIQSTLTAFARGGFFAA